MNIKNPLNNDEQEIVRSIEELNERIKKLEAFCVQTSETLRIFFNFLKKRDEKQ